MLVVLDMEKDKVQDFPPDLVDLINFYLELKKNKFYGTITQVWQDGQIVTLRKEQVFKVKDLHFQISI